MARLIPLILIALAVFFWLRARRKTAAYMASYENPAGSPGTHREPQAGSPGERQDPPAPAA
ncbi:hypothetical protein ACFY8O_03740 [Streptomyces argenteolus]|uniref:Secreted protein with PEP-CTERM sorting signal n=1 Tax=Streptomyces argenteolus TaxID=67274 RepID=A0ABW6X0Q1_9ACTN